jgi:streptomycin 6-kinase
VGARASEVFVGRVRELGELERLLDAAREGRGATVLVCGEAGIGKTRLTSELARRAHDEGLEVLLGRSIDLVGTELPYQPFVEALRPLGHPQAEAAKADSQLRVFEETLSDHALTCASRRGDAHRDEKAVLVHGDVHQWNALEGAGGFKLVDPDGLLAEPDYDLGIIMREDPLEGDLRERSRWLASETGLDEAAIWEWGVAERVSTGLLCVRVGLEAVGRDMLAAAERVAA